jgi:hypothetical protein
MARPHLPSLALLIVETYARQEPHIRMLRSAYAPKCILASHNMRTILALASASIRR